MKKLAITLSIILIGYGVLYAENEPTREEWKKMSRAERREYKEKIVLEQKDRTLELLNSKEWVLEATTLQNRYGETAHIESHLNFIGVSGNKSTVQLGSSGSGDMGYNGVGGITVDGNIARYELYEGNKANSGMSLALQVSGAVMGHVRMDISISPSGSASATIITLEGDRITYNGQIVPLNESSVYKGTSLP